MGGGREEKKVRGSQNNPAVIGGKMSPFSKKIFFGFYYFFKIFWNIFFLR